MQRSNARVLQRVQFGPETIPGTAVAANYLLKSFENGSFAPHINVEVTEHQPEGFKRPTDIQTNRVSIEASGNIKVSYTEIEKILLSVITKQYEQATVFSGVYRRSYVSKTIKNDIPQTYTMDYGSDLKARRSTDVMFTSLDIKTARTGVSGTTKLYGQTQINVTDGTYVEGTNTVQSITITGSPTGGNFTLAILIDGVVYTTAAILYTAIASAVQTAIITALGSLGTDSQGNNNVAVTGGPGPGTPYSVTFQNELGACYIPAMIATSAFTGGTSPATAIGITTSGGMTPGLNEAQLITVTATGGTFVLYVDNLPTVPIAFDAIASVVQAALQTVAGTNNVLVTGSAGAWTATFQWQKGGIPLPIMGYDATLLTGGSLTITETQQGGYVTETFIEAVGDDTRIFISTSPITFDPNSYPAPVYGPTNILYSDNFETEVNVGERFGPYWTQNGGASFTGYVERTANEMIDINVAYSDQVNFLQRDLYQGQHVWVRVLMVSKINIGATTYKYMMIIDVPCAVSASKALGQVDNTATYGYSLKVIGDVLVTVQNGMSAP